MQVTVGEPAGGDARCANCAEQNAPPRLAKLV